MLARRGKLSEAEGRLSALVRSRPGEDCRAGRALKGLRGASALKAEGNVAYKAGDWDRAGAQYSCA